MKFNEPIAVAWTNSTGSEKHLGSFLLDPLSAKNKRAYINETVPFTIDDEDAFAQFTSALITEQNFTWHLTSKKVDVRALTFLTAHDLNFRKQLVLRGMNNFQDNVTLARWHPEPQPVRHQPLHRRLRPLLQRGLPRLRYRLRRDGWHGQEQRYASRSTRPTE